jgi:7-cyano-7-deazaguanine reductase
MPTTKDDLKKLSVLGRRAKAARRIEVFPNHAPGDMEVTLQCHEFTCLCPLTKQPDFAQIEITYLPDQWLAESKSVKLYLESYREVGVFHEHLAVDIGKDFVKFVKPISADVVVYFNVRGGIAISAKYRYER